MTQKQSFVQGRWSHIKGSVMSFIFFRVPRVILHGYWECLRHRWEFIYITLPLQRMPNTSFFPMSFFPLSFFPMSFFSILRTGALKHFLCILMYNSCPAKTYSPIRPSDSATLTVQYSAVLVGIAWPILVQTLSKYLRAKSANSTCTWPSISPKGCGPK